MPRVTRTESQPTRDLVLAYEDLTPAVRRQIGEVLEPLLWIVPPWCRELVVSVGPLEEEAMCEIRVHGEYRQASVAISPELLTRDEAEQRRFLTHELVHILLDPMAEAGRKLVDAVLASADEAVGSLIEEVWTAAVESVTTDLDRTLSLVHQRRTR